MAKVMLVEDDNNLREIYEARLAAEGYEIVSAHDGEEALALAVKERPDLIISDVMMPKVSGFDMLDILRSTPETRDTKVIMMTALSQAEDRARADKLGADKYLVKSQVTLEDVVKVAHEVLEGSSTPAAPATTETPAPAAPADTPVSEPTPPVVSVPVAEPPADTPVADAPVADASTPAVPSSDTPASDTATTSDTLVPAPATDASTTDTPASTPDPTPAPAAPFSPEQTPELPTPSPASEPAVDSVAPEVTTEEKSETTPASDPTPATATPEPASPVTTEPVADPIPTTPAEQQIQDFLANSAATSNTTTAAEAVEPVSPVVIPVSEPPTAETPVKSVSPDDSEPEPEPTLAPSPDTVVDTPEYDDDNQTEPQRQKKVIQPINDMSAPSVDLNALLAKEEQSQASQVPAADSVITPTPEPANQNGTDPNAISL